MTWLDATDATRVDRRQWVPVALAADAGLAWLGRRNGRNPGR